MGQDRTCILCIGFPKSGTTTLYKALKSAGFDAVHWKREGEDPAGYKLYQGYMSSYKWKGDNVITQLDTCRKGINVWPQLDYEFLRWANERSKLILQMRSPEKILRSIKAHNDLMKRIVYAPGLFGERTTDTDMLNWIMRHYERVLRAIPDVLAVFLDDPYAPKIISSYLGVELPWWGVANATRRKTVRKKDQEVCSN